MNVIAIERFVHQKLVHVVYGASWRHRSGQLRQLWISLACDSMLRRCDGAYFGGRVVSSRMAATCLWCVGALVR